MLLPNTSLPHRSSEAAGHVLPSKVQSGCAPCNPQEPLPSLFVLSQKISAHHLHSDALSNIVHKATDTVLHISLRSLLPFLHHSSTTALPVSAASLLFPGAKPDIRSRYPGIHQNAPVLPARSATYLPGSDAGSSDYSSSGRYHPPGLPSDFPCRQDKENPCITGQSHM